MTQDVGTIGQKTSFYKEFVGRTFPSNTAIRDGSELESRGNKALKVKNIQRRVKWMNEE